MKLPKYELKTLADVFFKKYHTPGTTLEQAFDYALSTLPDAPALMVSLEEAREMRHLYMKGTSSSWDTDMLLAANTVLARRPAAQAPEPSPICEHGVGRVVCRFCNPDPAPTAQTLQAEGDVVQKVAIAIYEARHKHMPISSLADYAAMARAAHAISRQHFTAHPPEGLFTTEQVKEAIEQEGSVWQSVEAWSLFADHVIARLAPPKPTPQERVTFIERETFTQVLLDGIVQATVTEPDYHQRVRDVKRYAAGLRAELADKEKSQ